MFRRNRLIRMAGLALLVALVAGFTVGHFTAQPAEAAQWTLTMNWRHATYTSQSVGVLKSDIGTSKVNVEYYLSSNGLTWYGPYTPSSPTHQDSSCTPSNYAKSSTWSVSTTYSYIKWHVTVQGDNSNGKWEQQSCITVSSLESEKYIEPLTYNRNDVLAAWR